jgi:hypothetical protein
MPSTLEAEIGPGFVRFTFPGTVLRDCQVSRVGTRVLWHPSHLGGYPGISEQYRRAVEEWVVNHA